MNKFKFYSTVFILFIVLVSCKESIQYKYNDKPMLVTCQGADPVLLNEALYSFYEDITVYYRKKDPPFNEGMSTLEAYANYVYLGAMGEGDYENIVSEHSLQILNEMTKDKRLWNMGGAYSNLNHGSEFIACLISKIEDENLRATLISLQEINSISPKLLAERFRINTRDALDDPNYGMYIALDIYYQYILNTELYEKSNE